MSVTDWPAGQRSLMSWETARISRKHRGGRESFYELPRIEASVQEDRVIVIFGCRDLALIPRAFQM